jgi:hypothetical protein
VGCTAHDTPCLGPVATLPGSFSPCQPVWHEDKSARLAWLPRRDADDRTLCVGDVGVSDPLAQPRGRLVGVRKEGWPCHLSIYTMFRFARRRPASQMPHDQVPQREPDEPSNAFSRPRRGRALVHSLANQPPHGGIDPPARAALSGQISAAASSCHPFHTHSPSAPQIFHFAICSFKRRCGLVKPLEGLLDRVDLP